MLTLIKRVSLEKVSPRCIMRQSIRDAICVNAFERLRRSNHYQAIRANCARKAYQIWLVRAYRRLVWRRIKFSRSRTIFQKRRSNV